MEIVLGLLWIYGIWDGWKQITGASGLAVWLPTSALQWLNQKQAANIAVKACLAAVLSGLFAVFAVIGLLFKLMKYVAHM